LIPTEASVIGKACLLSLAVVAVADCGATAESPQWAPEQTIALNWHESAGPSGNRLIVDVRRFDVRPDGWAVSVGFKNDSRAT